jgi:hypothetical protein
MKKSTTIILAIVGLLVFSILLLPNNLVNAQAASAGSGQALEIGPPVINLSADPGTSVNAAISVRDVATTSLLVSGQVNDFVASGEDGVPKIILDGTVSKYSFKSWVAQFGNLILKPHEIKTFNININVPPNASPGGYYGVIRFTGTPPNLDGTGVSLSASVGSLVLLRVNGDAKESLNVVEFSASHNSTTGSLFEAAPIVFTERFKNTGNIQEEPTGLVTVKDMFGNVIATLGVNQPPHDILPDSIRKFTSSLDSSNIGNKFLFGLYHADMNVTYGTNKQVLTSSITFWVIPYTLIGIIIAALIIGFIALRAGIKRYNRYIIKQVQKNSTHK